MFRLKRKKIIPEVEQPIIPEFITLPAEYRSKYEPELLETKLLKMFTLEEMQCLLVRLSPSPNQWLLGTATFDICPFGAPYWDKQNNEIVLPIPMKERIILRENLWNWEYKRDQMFQRAKDNIRSLAQFIKDLKQIEPLLKDNSLFIDN